MAVSKQDLEKYLRPPYGRIVVGSILLIVGFLASMPLEKEIAVFLIFAVFGILYALPSVAAMIRCRKCISTLEQNETLDAVLADFSQGISLADDTICMGKKYIIGKGSCNVFRYDDIVQVYEYIHKTNFAVDDHQLMIEDSDEKMRVLCQLPKETSQGELMRIFEIIKKNNPSVKIGIR